ncbi:SxtJ family membrane protein [Lacibacter sp. H375]|uniref:SxtJ family membrane protein n=1 Tax=Lacibacter sp. H375 TaxID=3133424 RepID=UPI00403FED3F
MRWQAKHTSLVVIAAGFFLFYLQFNKLWLLGPVILSAIGFAIAPLGEFIHRGWMKLAKVLGYINSRVLLFLIFYVILTPLALIQRLCQSKKITERLKKNRFLTRNHMFAKDDFIKPW